MRTFQGESVFFRVLGLSGTFLRGARFSLTALYRVEGMFEGVPRASALIERLPQRLLADIHAIMRYWRAPSSGAKTRGAPMSFCSWANYPRSHGNSVGFRVGRILTP